LLQNLVYKPLEYLAGEVLAAQPEPIQAFLIQTSFLNRLTGALCDAVTGRSDGAQVLAQLERWNVFLVPLQLAGGQAWYRYHTLFSEALRQLARQRLTEAEVQALHAKASAWYAAHGLLGEAVEAALAAEQWEQAASLAERSLNVTGLSEVFTLHRWVEPLPSDMLRAHPLLAFSYAHALLYTSATDRYAPATGALMEKPLRLAEAAWRSEGDDARLGQVLALRGLAAWWRGDLARAFGLARESLELLADDDVFWRGVNLLSVGVEALLMGKVNAAQPLLIEARALSEAAQNRYAALAAMFMLGEAHVWRGELDQAGQYFQAILAEAENNEDFLDDQASARLGLGAIAYERNDLDLAEDQATQALDIGQRRGDEDMQMRSTLILARVHQARRLAAQAQALLQSLAVRLKRPLLLREVRAWQAQLAVAAGDVAAASQWHATLAAQSESISLTLQEREALVVARLRMVRGEHGIAVKLLEDWRASAQADGRTRSELEAYILTALAHVGQASAARAGQALTRALTLAAPRGYRRIFLDEGEPMAAPLRALMPQLRKRPLAVYAASLLRDLEPKPLTHAPPALPLPEPLSPQEQRVLRLLVAGLSNPEIARELVVSTNTIKTQVKSIYRKLDVTTREQAREAAREFNLL
jgi:LuxR family maltose regulon positive regulatory protein